MSEDLQRLEDKFVGLSWIVLGLITQLEDQHALDVPCLNEFLRTKARIEDQGGKPEAARVLRLAAVLLEQRGMP